MEEVWLRPSPNVGSREKKALHNPQGFLHLGDVKGT